jgi:hypothetical protein
MTAQIIHIGGADVKVTCRDTDLNDARTALAQLGDPTEPLFAAAAQAYVQATTTAAEQPLTGRRAARRRYTQARRALALTAALDEDR